MITLTKERCKSILQLLEEEAEIYRFRHQVFKGHDVYMSGKAARKLKATEDLILLVNRELHTTTAGQ